MNEELVSALAEHLAAPDPEDFASGPYPARRGHRLIQEGDPERFEILSWLADAYDQHVLIEMADRRVPRPRLS